MSSEDKQVSSFERTNNDAGFLDPTRNYGNAMNMFKSMFTDGQGNYDPNKAMNQFLGQSQGLANMVAGQTGPVGQMLTDAANRNSRIGGEAALAAMPGARNSGAGMAAFGDAYSKNFSDAAIQTQQAQLGLLSPLLNQSMGNQFDLMKTGLSGYGQMASQQGQFYMPTYRTTNPFAGLMSGAGAGAAMGTAINPGLGTGIGAFLGGLGGMFGGGS